MYPAQFLSLFPPFPRENRVFVAMSFDLRFDLRWNDVIKPGIESVLINDIALEAFRVDSRQVSDSIMTDILQGISKCRLVFADITMLEKHNNQVFRNSNVMYEVGLAHAARQPEEVLLFRSDNEPLLFDVANIRVNSYNPDDNQEAARHIVTRAIVDALREIDLRKSLVVQKAVESLGYDGFMTLLEVSQGLVHPTIRTMGETLGFANKRINISRLLDAGMILTSLPQFSPELAQATSEDRPMEQFFTYRLTSFGEEVMKAAAVKLGITPQNAAAWEEELGKDNLGKPPSTAA